MHLKQKSNASECQLKEQVTSKGLCPSSKRVKKNPNQTHYPHQTNLLPMPFIYLFNNFAYVPVLEHQECRRAVMFYLETHSDAGCKRQVARFDQK